jgi:hypothetical protein
LVFLVDGVDEQRPAVLQVGDHHHADDADDELAPSSNSRLRGGFDRRRFDYHRSPLSGLLPRRKYSFDKF